MERIMESLIDTTGLVAIIRNVAAKELVLLCEALYQGGVRVIECPFNQSSDRCLYEVEEKLSALRDHFGDKVLLGAGTVLNKEQLDCAYHAGAQLIVSPNVSERIIKQTKEYGLISMPGALTPTEIVNAVSYGADYPKVFPAETMGADYFKALLAPLSHLKLVAVGGMKLQDIAPFLSSGAYGFGIGSTLYPKEAFNKKDYETITQSAKQFITEIHKGKTNH